MQRLSSIARVARSILSSRMTGARVPLFVGAAVTDRCDGECIYCRRSGPGGEDLDTATWIRILEGMAAAGTYRVSFTGGEPLMRRDIGRLIHEARELGLNVSLNTNGYRLDSRLEEVVRADSLTLSYDGPEEVMDAHRGAGSHRKALRGLHAALAAGVPTMLRTTLTVLNVDRVDDILEEAGSLGVRVGFSPLRSVPLGDRDRSLFPPAGEFRTAIERLIRIKRRGSRTVLNSFACLAHMRRWPDPCSMRCSAGRIYARVEPDGEVYACGDHVVGGEHVSAIDLGFGEAFATVETPSCESCWCDTRVEMNLLYDLDPVAAVEAFVR